MLFVYSTVCWHGTAQRQASEAVGQVGCEVKTLGHGCSDQNWLPAAVHPSDLEKRPDCGQQSPRHILSNTDSPDVSGM